MLILTLSIDDHLIAGAIVYHAQTIYKAVMKHRQGDDEIS